ncbi:MAG: hypothetical protein Q7R95_01575 [bacterium]|nr:hypothetical protein [bacterium]
MNKPTLIILIIFGFILFILFILVLINPFTSKPKTITITPSINPTVKISPVPTSLPAYTPTPILPTSTGAREDIPSSAMSISIQKQNLIKKLPIQTNEYSITFNYETDLFDVIINDPINTDSSIFYDWVKKNYPAIPTTKFSIK